MLLIIGFGAVAFGNRFRLYSLFTIIVLVGAGMLTAIDSPQISAGLPTPWIGVWERINIGAYMLWVIVLAIILLKQEGKQQKAANIYIVNKNTSYAKS